MMLSDRIRRSLDEDTLSFPIDEWADEAGILEQQNASLQQREEAAKEIMRTLRKAGRLSERSFRNVEMWLAQDKAGGTRRLTMWEDIKAERKALGWGTIDIEKLERLLADAEALLPIAQEAWSEAVALYIDLNGPDYQERDIIEWLTDEGSALRNFPAHLREQGEG